MCIIWACSCLFREMLLIIYSRSLLVVTWSNSLWNVSFKIKPFILHVMIFFATNYRINALNLLSSTFLSRNSNFLLSLSRSLCYDWNTIYPTEIVLTDFFGNLINSHSVTARQLTLVVLSQSFYQIEKYFDLDKFCVWKFCLKKGLKVKYFQEGKNHKV